MSEKLSFRGQMRRKTVAICIAAQLHNLLITAKVVPLEKVSFSDAQNPETIS